MYNKGVKAMDVIFAALAIVVLIIMGAGLLTLVGMVLSLGKFENKESRERLEHKFSDSGNLSESANWG